MILVCALAALTTVLALAAHRRAIEQISLNLFQMS